jgi:hypothetical protein
MSAMEVGSTSGCVMTRGWLALFAAGAAHPPRAARKNTRKRTAHGLG